LKGAGIYQSIELRAKGWMDGVSIPARGEKFSFLRLVQTASEAHPALYLMETGTLSPGTKRPNENIYFW
jgi:hypothetical protein